MAACCKAATGRSSISIRYENFTVQASWCPWARKQNCVAPTFARSSRALLWPTGSGSVRKYDMASPSGRGRVCAGMEWK